MTNLMADLAERLEEGLEQFDELLQTIREIEQELVVQGREDLGWRVRRMVRAQLDLVRSNDHDWCGLPEMTLSDVLRMVQDPGNFPSM